jgi:signal recognition particle subunit SRP54
MFNSLGSKLKNTFRNLRGLGKISESNVSDALRDVRMALLEVDVNFEIARDFI